MTFRFLVGFLERLDSSQSQQSRNQFIDVTKMLIFRCFEVNNCSGLSWSGGGVCSAAQIAVVRFIIHLYCYITNISTSILQICNGNCKENYLNRNRTINFSTTWIFSFLIDLVSSRIYRINYRMPEDSPVSIEINIKYFTGEEKAAAVLNFSDLQ